MDPNERYYTPAELAKRWKVSARTMDRVIQRKEIGALRVGRQYRISESDVILYEQEHMNMTPEEFKEWMNS